MSEPTRKSMLVALADAVAAALNAAQAVTPPAVSPFDTPFTALRLFIAVRDLSTLPYWGTSPATAPLVAVVPMADPEERRGGGASPSFSGQYELDVTIYSRVGAGADAEAACATLMDLRQQIREFFKGVFLTVTGTRTSRAVLAGVSGAAFDEAALWEEGLFVSPQTLKFAMTV